MTKYYGIKMNTKRNWSTLLKLFPLWLYIYTKYQYMEVTIGIWKYYFSIHIGKEELMFN